jgi:hypothetical protein
MSSISIETKKMTDLDQAAVITLDDLVLVHTANGMRVCTVRALFEGGSVSVPTATTTVAGIVKPDGTSILVKADGTISAKLPDPTVAAVGTLGVVKPDGTTITIKADGTISAKQKDATIATDTTPGIVKPDGTTVTVDEDGTISAKQAGIATTAKAGLVMPDGTTITVDASGKIVAKQPSIATAAAAGLVKPDGATLSVESDGTLKVIGGGGGLSVENNAGAHNAIYRGKYLGNTYTAAQQAAVAAGTFDDLFIGDYWTIGGVNYRIAGFDYYLNNGDTACATHHMIVVPDTQLYTHVMNDTNVTEGGYYGSKMRTSGLNQAKTTAESAFGASHILSHREYLTNAVSNGRPSGGSWYDCTVELMSERMVYGNGIFMPVSDGTNVPSNYTVSKGQLPLFLYRHDLIGNRENWWLRDVITVAYFAFVNSSGFADCNDASYAFGVRPAIPVS